MSLVFKFPQLIFFLLFISCSEVDLNLLPKEYPLTIENNSIHLVAHKTTVYALNSQIEDLKNIKEYPKNEFRYGYCNDCQVKTWTACDNFHNNEIKEISNRLNKANDVYKNIEIENLSKRIALKDKNLFYSGYFKIRNDGKELKDIYEYFYLLDIKNEKVYEFNLNY